MFMHKSKKGFTIVELVIVIAVIAILAAVLIPTFSNLVKKANIANDTALAKNINTALTAYEAINGKVDEFSDVIAAARDAGYIISNLNPTTEGCYFVWESKTNQILLVDGEKNYDVIYANNEKYEPIGETWYFATSDKTAAAELKNDATTKLFIVKDMVANIADLSAAIADGGKQTLYMDESVVLSSANTLKIDNVDADITIEMGDSTLNTNGTITGIPVFVSVGKLTINGGNIGGSGSYTNEHGTHSTAIGYDAGELVLNGTAISANYGGISGCANDDGNAKIEVNDSTIKAGSYAVIVSCGGKGAVATLNNTNTEAAVPVFVSQGGKVVINGGTHVSTGKKSPDNFINAIFYVQKDKYGAASVEITDGTFVCNGVTKTYGELCSAGENAWKALCTDPSKVDVVIYADKVTITAK